MAKKCMICRDEKRRRTVKKYAAKRAALREVLANVNATEDEQETARYQLQSLPRNASPCRLRNRCKITGRPHGYYRRFGLGRNKLREAAMQGFVPGLVKSSW
ncbi:MAG: 30S ribosomal protein S14 [Pseudomonadota bacterium]